MSVNYVVHLFFFIFGNKTPVGLHHSCGLSGIFNCKVNDWKQSLVQNTHAADHELWPYLCAAQARIWESIFKSLTLWVEDLFPIASFLHASPKSQISFFLHLVTQGCLLRAVKRLLPVKVKIPEMCPEESKETPSLEIKLPNYYTGQTA